MNVRGLGSGYVALYLVAVIVANLTITAFGPGAAIAVAFLWIGLDLTARDALHETWRGEGLARKMALLIGAGSALSWILNRDAAQIALASFVAFAAAGTADALVYHALSRQPRWLRINGSNVPSAAVDSLLFPALAFGLPLLWGVMLGQFAAKVAGGFVWSLFLRRWDARQLQLARGRTT